MASGTHPLLDPYMTNPVTDTGASSVAYDNGRVSVDATPIYLFAMVIAAGLVLWGFKASGFRFVIGVGQ